MLIFDARVVHPPVSEKVRLVWFTAVVELTEIPAPPITLRVPCGLEMPMMLAPLLEMVIFGPAERVIVPVLDPPGTDPMFPPPPPPVGPIMVTPPAEDDRVMLDPAASRIGPEATVVVPAVAPPAVMDEIPKLLTTLPVVDTVTVLFPAAREFPEPEDKTRCPC